MTEGTRVRTTAKYDFMFPKSSHRYGVILGRPKTKRLNDKECWRVKFDDVATPMTLHQDFIRPINE